jgi:O-antigen/teichoic acid export membrane protein
MNDKDILKANIIQGFSTLIVREFFIKIFSLVGQIFLARLLIPSDFGVYVIIVFIISLFGLFSDVGLSLAIIQHKTEPTKRELSSAFYLKTLLGLGLIVLVWIISPSVKLFYPSFAIANVTMLRVLSITLLLTNFRSIPTSLLERKIKYNIISLVDIAGIVVYYLIALSAALFHFGVWSFIIAAVIKEIAETIILFIVQPFIPQLMFSIKSLKKMLRFGLYIQGNSLVGFLATSINPVIGGRMVGTYGVGLLDFAFNIGSLPTTIGINFGRVAFAGYSRIQEQKKLLSNSMSRSISMLAIMLYIFPVIVFSFAGQLIPFVFSAKWIPAIPALYWYTAVTFFLPVIAPLGQGILAIGKSKEIFWSTFITAVLGWIGAYLLVQSFGMLGIAIIYFLTVLFLFIFYILILRKYGFEFRIFSILVPKLAAVILVIAFSIFLNRVLPGSIIMLFVKLFLSCVAYLLLMFLLAKKDLVDFIGLIMHWLKLSNT